jgi:hypothetical protein
VAPLTTGLRGKAETLGPPRNWRCFGIRRGAFSNGAKSADRATVRGGAGLIIGSLCLESN